MKSWTKAYLGLGSNVGNRGRNLKRAVESLSQSSGVRIRKISRVYETSPIGPRQRKFLNAAAEIETNLGSRGLLSLLKRLEAGLGRKKMVRWGPREIDLDILFYGNERKRSEFLTLPHPRYAQRKFVLKPLLDLAPGLKPPGEKRTIRRIFSQLTDPAQRVKLHNKSVL